MLTIDNQEVRPRHRGELRVLVAATRPAGLRQVRAYLIADLLRRISEREGLAPTVADLSPGHEESLRAFCDALNIHPPRHTLAPPVRLDGLFADGIRQPVFDVGVRLADETPDESLAALWTDATGPDREGALGEEPLIVRLELMGFDGDVAATLGRWRRRVAEWARSPSGAMSRAHSEEITAAFAANLDAATALRVLTGLEDDEGVPDGVKFETFAAADRLFGLDLARDIGKLSRRSRITRNEPLALPHRTQRIAPWTHYYALLVKRRRSVGWPHDDRRRRGAGRDASVLPHVPTRALRRDLRDQPVDAA